MPRKRKMHVGTRRSSQLRDGIPFDRGYPVTGTSRGTARYNTLLSMKWKPITSPVSRVPGPKGSCGL